jgi:transposase InsO family protein
MMRLEIACGVAAVHERSRKTYGSPRVHAELRAKGVRVSKKRIERLMRENGLEARRKRRFRKTTDSKHNQPIAPNVVARKFDVSAPNRVWATDVTAIWTLEGWLFLAVMPTCIPVASLPGQRARTTTRLSRSTP